MNNYGFNTRGCCDECQRTTEQGHHPSCINDPRWAYPFSPNLARPESNVSGCDHGHTGYCTQCHDTEVVKTLRAEVATLKETRDSLLGVRGNMLRYVAFVTTGDEMGDALLGVDRLKTRAEQAEANVAWLREALTSITKIENRYDGGDWDEIDEAREVARAALAATETL